MKRCSNQGSSLNSRSLRLRNMKSRNMFRWQLHYSNVSNKGFKVLLMVGKVIIFFVCFCCFSFNLLKVECHRTRWKPCINFVERYLEFCFIDARILLRKRQVTCFFLIPFTINKMYHKCLTSNNLLFPLPSLKQT